jgi:hypothetical protein
MPHTLVKKHTWAVPTWCLHAPLPLRCIKQLHQWAAAVTRTFILADDTLANVSNVICCRAQVTASDIANEYKIGQQCMEMVYMFPNLYHESFDELVDLRQFDLLQHWSLPHPEEWTTYSCAHDTQYTRCQDTMVADSTARHVAH